jgi:hypothetical protein
MSGLLHETPFPLKVFGDVIFCRRKNLFNGHIDSKVSPLQLYKPAYWLSSRKFTLVHIAERTRAEFLPVAFDVLNEL